MSFWDTVKAAFWDLVTPPREEDPDPQSTAEATAARTRWIREHRHPEGGDIS